MLHAGHVLRTCLTANDAHAIRDRKYHLRTFERCCVGSEMVDWMLAQTSLPVKTRSQAVAMWQVMLEQGVIAHGKCYKNIFSIVSAYLV